MLLELLAIGSLGMAAAADQQRRGSGRAIWLNAEILRAAHRAPPAPTAQIVAMAMAEGEDEEVWQKEVDEELPSGMPSLMELLGLEMTLYAVSSDDGYLFYTTKDLDEAIGSAEHLTEQEGTTEVAVTRFDHVRMYAARAVLDKDYADGYDGFGILQKAAKSSKDVWSWNMYDEVPFEEWWEDNKNQTRDSFMYDLPKYEISVGSLLYHSTNILEPWEEEFEPEGYDYSLRLVNTKDAALEKLTEEDWRTKRPDLGTPGPRRLLTFKVVKAPIVVYDITSTANEWCNLDDFCKFFEIDLDDDAEDIAKKFTEYRRYLKLPGFMYGPRPNVTVIVTDPGTEQLRLIYVEEF